MSKIPSRRAFTLLLLAPLLLLTACDEETTGPEATEVWQLDAIPGNFTVNGTQLTTHQDGMSFDYVADYVLTAALPTTAMTAYSFNIYVPKDEGMAIRLSGMDVRVQRQDGTTTANVYSGGAFLHETTMGGQLYSVFRLDGNFTGSPAITRANFANATFSFTIFHEEQDETVLNSRSFTFEVYSRASH